MRNPLLTAVFLPILVGCIALTNIARQPRFALIHNVDVVTLIASGMCFGAALAALLTYLLRSRQAA